jgi:hypothetical protein
MKNLLLLWLIDDWFCDIDEVKGLSFLVFLMPFIDASDKSKPTNAETKGRNVT